MRSFFGSILLILVLAALGVNLDAQLLQLVLQSAQPATRGMCGCAQASRTWRRAPRGPYWPHDGHAVCCRWASRQAGFAQVTVGTTEAFHCARRERVLLRDIFRFGTATSVSFVRNYKSLLLGDGPRSARSASPTWDRSADRECARDRH